MAEKLTPQQEAAVKNRGGKLLVSAAAGSGKTKVLVDRLMSYLMDPADPANIDDFLIITYTKAAAAELRGKIAVKLSDSLAEDPENVHLQRQMQRLYLTKISTVHSFCADILREHAYLVDIPGDFRVAEENECSQLRETVMNRMLERAYDSAEVDDDFRAFVDAQGLGRDDRLVPEILLKVYDSARCHLDPEGWLTECMENIQADEISDAGQTIWGKYLLEDLFHYLDLQIGAMERCAAAAEAAEGMEKPALLLKDTVHQLKMLRDSSDWDAAVRRKNIDYGRVVISKKCPDQELAERIKSVRDGCKKGLEKKLRNFSENSAVILSDLKQTEASVRGILALVRRFDREFSAAKRSRRMLDFSDLEHKMLDLLLGRKRSSQTAAAREIGERFREIMVDEYQDSNAVQDAIFSALTQQRKNCFMVGDVKQSIYQFRLADPGIFLEKYEQYAPAAEAKTGQGRKVILSSNFRSGGAVLESVNDIFRYCMSPGVGGLQYGEEEALREGIAHEPLGDSEVELWTVSVKESTYKEEAEFVAQRVQDLLKSGAKVRDKDGLRAVVPEDIAILLRSPGSSASWYVDALARRGIRCITGSGENLLLTEEIETLQSILQLISNPRQDIPLISALASPVFGFSADDLAAFRGDHRKGAVYDALICSELPKAKHFLEVMEKLRWESKVGDLSQLIEKIFLETRLDSIYAARPGGDVRLDNLQTFYQMAADFEKTGQQGLDSFLEYLQILREKGLSTSAEISAPGAVTLTSIHKSKGLEFPVVIVAGLSRTFNRESLRAQVLCDKTLGLGLSSVDRKNRLRYPTIAKRAIAVKTASDSLSEELRVLYVALTRAKDRLIMTYAAQKPENDIVELVHRMDMSDPELLASDVVCPGEWVLMSALRRTEAGALFALGERPSETHLGEPPWHIAVTEAPEDFSSTADVISGESELPEKTLETLRRNVEFRYPYMAAVRAPSKQTATQRKGRTKDQEVAEHAQEPKEIQRSWRKPAFHEVMRSGKDYGNALHAAMQYLRFEACGDLNGVKDEICRLVSEKYILPEQGEMVDCEKIAAFFQTPLGKKIRTEEQVLREFKFSILDDGENYDRELVGEQILLQGVVDCAILEPDGITVLDFKTDHVTSQTMPARAEHYRPQVQAYVHALSRIYGRPVKEALLYFFETGEFVSCM